MSEFMKRLKKASHVQNAEVMSRSQVFGEKRKYTTPVPMLNVAFSGDVRGGFQCGVNVFAGPSKHFKSLFCLLCAKTFQDTHEDGIIVFFDSEFGSPPDYFQSLGLDTERILHVPITTIEQLKIDVSKIIDEAKKEDNLCIVIDSIGNLASLKETEDALEGKVVGDMTRAKQVKSLFRIITPSLTIKDIPLFAVAHTYETQEMYSKTIVSGGTGTYYAGNNIFIVGRQQVKDGTDIEGYDFILKAEKSRFIKEGSKIPISVRFSGGIEQYSGLLDVALEGGYVIKPNQGWYQPNNPKTQKPLSDSKVRKADTNTKQFWDLIFQNTDFDEFVRSMYQLSTMSLISKQESDDKKEVSTHEETISIPESI